MEHSPYLRDRPNAWSRRTLVEQAMDILAYADEQGMTPHQAAMKRTWEGEKKGYLCPALRRRATILAEKIELLRRAA